MWTPASAGPQLPHLWRGHLREEWGWRARGAPAAAAHWRGGLGAGLPSLLPGGNRRMYSTRPSCCGRGAPAGRSAGSVGEPLGCLAGLWGPLTGGEPEKGNRHERSLIIWAGGQPGPGGSDWSEVGVMSGQGEGTVGSGSVGPESTLSSRRGQSSDPQQEEEKAL